MTNNICNTETSKQLYDVNAAVYISGVCLNSCEFMEKHQKAIVKMEQTKKKLSKLEKKLSHYEEKVSEYYDAMCFNDYLTMEFYSDKTQPWLKDENLSYEEKDTIISIAKDLRLYPYCDDEDIAA